MRRLSLHLVTALVVLSTSVVVIPEASAVPRDYILINYYDCSFNLVASSYRDCAAVWHFSGSTAAAAYRETAQYACGDNTLELYALDQGILGVENGWETYTGGTSPYCQCVAQNAC